MSSRIWVVMRCRNDLSMVTKTLAMLFRQKHPFELLAFDNNSTDGSREEIVKYTSHVVDVPEGQYVPGRILNQAMARTQGDYVVFVNSDCIPQNELWLENLLAGFSNEKVAAVFGRQIPHPDCHPLYAKDTEATYGDGSLQKYWRHCFSMASSAIARKAWQQHRFNEKLQYSEDIDWTWQIKQHGYQINYVADSVVMHSHNYTWRQYYRRQFGEGCAEAQIFAWTKWRSCWLRYSLLPYCSLVLSDLKYGFVKKDWRCLSSPFLRTAQLFGRHAGFVKGQKLLTKELGL